MPRARVQKGAVTDVHSANRAAVLRMLTDSLASELECILRYRRHHFMARGMQSQGVAQELLAHSYEKLAHADQIVERMVQLGGVPDLAPDALAGRNHAEHVEGDPTTRRMLEGILAAEEKHADELSGLLVAFPEGSSAMPRAAKLR